MNNTLNFKVKKKKFNRTSEDRLNEMIDRIFAFNFEG